MHVPRSTGSIVLCPSILYCFSHLFFFFFPFYCCVCLSLVEARYQKPDNQSSSFTFFPVSFFFPHLFIFFLPSYFSCNPHIFHLFPSHHIFFTNGHTAQNTFSSSLTLCVKTKSFIPVMYSHEYLVKIWFHYSFSFSYSDPTCRRLV